MSKVRVLLIVFAMFFTFGMIWGNVTGADAVEQPAAVIVAKPDDPKCLVDQAAFEDIKKKRIDLDEKEKSIVEREKELAAREGSLNEELKKLKELRDEIAGIDLEKNKKLQEKIAKLVETIERMSPKKASELLENVDDQLAVSAMFQISTEKLAKIMNTMQPEKASRLTELLTLGRKVSSIPSAKGGDKNDNGQHIKSGAGSTTPAAAAAPK